MHTACRSALLLAGATSCLSIGQVGSEDSVRSSCQEKATLNPQELCTLYTRDAADAMALRDWETYEALAPGTRQVPAAFAVAACHARFLLFC